ncbi:MAG: zinc ribbon domain-containing protein [Candidatus Fermentibacter sp.]|nr:zinc ribbon domain-containing protein [Candidatus Fermentibacter sp.]
MPIYEYLCRSCNLIFQFFVRSPGGAGPACPKCGAKGLERVMSSFATVRGTSSRSSGDDGIPADLAGLDESDPRAMARAIRRMADEMGESLGPELDEAITRLEAGEDPGQVERELEDAGLSEDDDSGPQHPVPPARDPGLYDA